MVMAMAEKLPKNHEQLLVFLDVFKLVKLVTGRGLCDGGGECLLATSGSLAGGS